jgi:vacuolar-type H+-ATPase subunit C/Vma6
MSNYTKSTDFEAKDALPSGDSDKIIRGAEFEVEFDNIAVAVNSKADSNSPVFISPITIDGAQLTDTGSNTLVDARVAESNVTQHEANMKLLLTMMP